MHLFRCENENCDGGEYESLTGECPKCKGFLAVPLVAVHYLAPADGPIQTGLGGRMIACEPTMRELPQCSGERSAVTCPKCKASEIFLEDERDNISNHVRYFERIANTKHGQH